MHALAHTSLQQGQVGLPGRRLASPRPRLVEAVLLHSGLLRPPCTLEHTRVMLAEGRHHVAAMEHKRLLAVARVPELRPESVVQGLEVGHHTPTDQVAKSLLKVVDDQIW